MVCGQSINMESRAIKRAVKSHMPWKTLGTEVGNRDMREPVGAFGFRQSDFRGQEGGQ